jgi:hypothetical protein
VKKSAKILQIQRKHFQCITAWSRAWSKGTEFSKNLGDVLSVFFGILTFERQIKSFVWSKMTLLAHWEVTERTLLCVTMCHISTPTNIPTQRFPETKMVNHYSVVPVIDWSNSVVTSQKWVMTWPCFDLTLTIATAYICIITPVGWQCWKSFKIHSNIRCLTIRTIIHSTAKFNIHLLPNHNLTRAIININVHLFFALSI